MTQKDTNRRSQLLERIFTNCKIDSGSGCWIWQGGTSGDGRGGGYGRISVDGMTMATHRVVFICMHGPVSSKKQIDHVCANRLCCNPGHLELVSHIENQKRKK